VAIPLAVALIPLRLMPPAGVESKVSDAPEPQSWRVPLLYAWRWPTIPGPSYWRTCRTGDVVCCPLVSVDYDRVSVGREMT